MIHDGTKLEVFSKFLGEIKKETDMGGAAIVAASILDQKLKAVLAAYLIVCGSTKSVTSLPAE